jgi:hypothetical protein
VPTADERRTPDRGRINRAAPKLYSVHGSERHALPEAPAAQLATAPSALLTSPGASSPNGSPSSEHPDDDGGHRDA